MAVSPLDLRYKSEMNALFDEENKLAKWLMVESALAKAEGKVGRIPRSAAAEIDKKANLKYVKLERVKEIEREIDHDLMAMVKALSEVCSGDAGKYVHLGATSYDIEDTAHALILRDAIKIIEAKLAHVKQILLVLADENRKMVCIGRTHGQHAVPTTYGMKFVLYASEIGRHQKRLEQAKERMLIGKMSGAVGTMSTFGREGHRIQDYVMRELSIEPALVTNQVIQRDRHAEVLFVLSLIGCTLEKIAKEIRNLQRTEIMEIAEPFGRKQVGSSTMPHKRNPHRCERICSLARLLRADVSVALENIALEHERDLTNSANERFIIPESFIVANFMLNEMIDILVGLEFFPENIRKNIELSKGQIMAERLMILLAHKGMSRQEAHELLRKASIKAFKEGKHLKEALSENRDITKYLNEKELEDAFDPNTYIGEAAEIVGRALRELKRG
ncbi:MAG: Adenylosuccinate lyase [Candidatus Fermentimicrarchaeum limneticum]|uniref:Adenylosuccinate lyase n=1 Tax=Fermentimicrarchaeum limneticum TaxID=2795018 RepID=A0A7D5XL71_FERL1|nr:MAG: Adenylosuccinate lyase [Candidatus Fermentimicrarchaeum limneticum]